MNEKRTFTCQGCGQVMTVHGTTADGFITDTCKCDMDCDHAGEVINGECRLCGETGLESENEIYESENPR